NAGDETGFRVEQSTNGTTFVQVATVAAGVTTYRHNGLTPNTLYFYRVRAYNAAGNSAYSNVVQVTTKVK
ncbi:MAG: fibronectin type III domain-containing protein, partial [Acidobacteria bacterium]|nr:fibronectin type III domain-containing protein [Acidobacteriota bacterium]